MTLIQDNDELEIINIGNLLRLNLKIPEYQRPYSWSSSSTNTLFIDTYEAFESGINEYRLGSVILHKDKTTNQYNLVDGQQRTTTLTILLYVLGEKSNSLLKEKYSSASLNAINHNYALLLKRVNELDEYKRESYKKYLKEHCTVIKIVTDNEQEAFQFFDSQNTRGKALKPHDLLKSYHLREMSEESEELKIKLISQWENMDQNALEDLFNTYLYPVIRWFKNRDGLNYSSDKIHHFKGINQSSNYNYTIYHKASHIFIEKVNSSASRKLLNSGELSQFQLTQPIISGKIFFDWTLYYARLLEQVKNKIENYHSDKNEIPSVLTGDIYIKQLYEASLLFFADRFSFDAMDDAVMHQLYTWCYSLRIEMYSVRIETINNYARGLHNRINIGKDLFSLLSEMKDPRELKELVFDRIDQLDNQKYEKIYNRIKQWNRW